MQYTVEKARETAREYVIIDAHTHIYPEKIAAKAAESIGAFYQFTSRYSEGSIEKMFEVSRPYGVSAYLVCSVATTPAQVSSINAFVRGQCDAHPEFYGFGAMHPQTPDPETVVEDLLSLGLRGVKLHPDFQRFHLDSRDVYPIYEVCEGVLPILVHMGDARYDYSRPARLKRVLEDFPNLHIIAAHLGGWQVWDDARAMLRHDNVRFDTSSALQTLSTADARRQILSLGVEKCFFGTDYPVWDYDLEFARFFDIGLSRRENAKILSENFVAFIDGFGARDANAPVGAA